MDLVYLRYARIDSRDEIEEEIPDAHKRFVEDLKKKYNVPDASEPGMRRDLYVQKRLKSSSSTLSLNQTLICWPVESVHRSKL